MPIGSKIIFGDNVNKEYLQAISNTIITILKKEKKHFLINKELYAIPHQCSYK